MRLVLLFLCVFATMFAPAPSAAQQFQYDNAGRLTAAIYSNGASISYEYDANSNVTRIAFDDGVVDPVAPNGVIDTPSGNVSIEAGRSVNFTATATDSDNATPFTYLWDFNGGATNSTVEDPGNVTFPTAGTYTVTFTVTDATSLADPTPDSVVVTVTAASTGGGGSSGSSSSGGGGAAFLLPILAALFLLARKCRSLLLVTMILAGGAQAQQWTEMTSGTTQNLRDVWMESANLAYAVGDNGTVLRFDGADWSPVDVGGTTARLNSVWGTSANDVWIVGASGTVLHFDGASWTPIDIGAGPAYLNDVWTPGAGQTVHIVGVAGAWEYDGVSWTRQAVKVGAFGASLEPPHNFTAVRGTDNYLVMTGNNFFGADGGLWVDYDWIGTVTFILNDVWVYDDTFMLAVGGTSYRMNGGDPTSRSGAWERINMSAEAVWGTSPTSIWTAGASGTTGLIAYGDGTMLDSWVTQLTVGFRQFYGLHGVDDQTVMAVGTLGAIYGFFAEPPEPPTPTSSNFFFSYTNDDGVNTLTGELIRTETDFALPGDVPLYFERYYAGALSTNMDLPLPFGEGWSHSYNWTCVQNVAPDQVKIVDYRGTEFLFENNGSGYNLVSPGSANVGLVESGGELIFYDRVSSQRAYFDLATCRMTEIKNRHGNSIFMNYTGTNLTSVSDAHGSLIDITYNGAAQIETVSVVRDTTLSRSYTYDANGRLATTVSPRNVETQYAYNADGFFIRATYGVGTADETTRRTYEYVGDKVSASTLNNGGRFEYAYDSATGVTTETQPDGATQTFTHDANGNLIATRSAEQVIQTYEYDMLGRRVAANDGAGRRTEWTYDASSGRLASVREPGDFLTVRRYRSRNLPDGVTFHDIEMIDHPDGGTTTFRYDASGNLIQIEDPEGNFTDFTYDSDGNILTREYDAGGIHTYTYNDRAQPVSHTDPNGNTTTYAYDAFGRRTERTDATGTIEASYSNGPLPDQVTYPSGANMQVQYDALDRVARQNLSDGRYLQFGYDAAGNFISLDHSGLDAITASYDTSGYVSSLSRNGFLKQSIQRNDDGQPKSITDGEGNVWQFEYGSDGLIIGLVRPNASRIDFSRNTDPRGFVTSITNGTDITSFEYDSIGHVARIADPLGRSVGFDRDLKGDVLTATLGPVNAQHSYTRNEFGDWTSYVDPLGGTYTRDYGSDSLLDSETDANGNTTTIARDEKNRPEEISFDDGLSVTARYGTNDLLQQISGSDGAVIDIDTTAEGVLIGGTNLALGRTPALGISESNDIQATRDNENRVAKLTFPSSFSVDYIHDGNDNATEIADSAGGMTTIVRGEYGHIISITTPDGRTTTYQRDDDGRPLNIDISGIGSMTATRGPGGRIESSTSTIGGPPDIQDEIREFSYDIGSRKMSESHDVRGNALTNGDLDLAWDAFYRLIEMDDGTNTTTYDHDLFGNFVSETSGTDARVFVQNYVFGQPFISIEEDGSGNVIWNYVHTPDGRPLYRINPSNERQYYHFDLRGNTIMITDEAGDILNRYVYAPHGETIDREETVENFLTTSGQFGGFEMADGQTINRGRTYFDTKSSDKLSDEFNSVRYMIGVATENRFASSSDALSAMLSYVEPGERLKNDGFSATGQDQGTLGFSGVDLSGGITKGLPLDDLDDQTYLNSYLERLFCSTVSANRRSASTPDSLPVEERSRQPNPNCATLLLPPSGNAATALESVSNSNGGELPPSPTGVGEFFGQIFGDLDVGNTSNAQDPVTGQFPVAIFEPENPATIQDLILPGNSKTPYIDGFIPAPATKEFVPPILGDVTGVPLQL